MTATHDEAGRREAIERLSKHIKGIRFAMLTSVAADGGLRSRPMATQEMEADGDLWFFTGASTSKIGEVERNPQVNLSFADPDDNRYVSLSGAVEVVRDRQKMAELWSPMLKAWFPQGLDDPDLLLLKVTPEGAEYWDSPNSKMVQLVGLAKALTTGKRYEGGENEELDLKR